MNTLFTSFKNLLIFAIFIFLNGVSLYGLSTAENTAVQNVGTMQIAPFKTGFALFQEDRGYYYAFSPANDYFLSSNNVRSSLILGSEAAHENYKSDFEKSHWDDIKQTVESYLGVAQPELTFKTQKTIQYKTYVSGNKLRVTEKITFPDENSKPRVIGATMSYQPIDFVYDQNGNPYNYWADSDFALFEKLYNVRLVPNTYDLRIKIPEGKIFVMNPSLASVIVVEAGKGQTLWVNRNAKLIEVEQEIKPKNGSYTTEIQAEVFKNPKEARKAL